MIEFFRLHGTKVLGFAQVTVGALAGATHLFGPRSMQVILLVAGLLTAWRGFFNSSHFSADPSDEAGA